MQAFVDVVEQQGFSAAARKVGRSKALMSKYVRELEDELGILLLNRTTRQFSLTEAGEVFHKSAMEILKKVSDLHDTVREAGKGFKGRLRISAPRSLTDLEIGLPIVEFAAAFPDITLDIDLDDAMVDMVEEGFDVAIRISRLTDSALIAKKLAGFRISAAKNEFMSPGDMKEQATTDRDEVCAMYRMIAPEKGESSIGVERRHRAERPLVTYREWQNQCHNDKG